VSSAPDPDDDRPRVRLTREDLGSWLSGPSSVTSTDQDYRGQRLGLPAEGPGSLAGWGRRLAALLVDWLACLLLVRLFLPGIDYGTPSSSLATLGFFLAELTLFTWLVGASFGQRVLGLSVVRLEGGSPGLVRALVRSLQVCLLVPALVWDRDGRGLHDRSVGTVLVRR
jgi:uncharacterized RDD family membrane protein YckC